jgi:hypoxanthine phosphoribosyltransferase
LKIVTLGPAEFDASCAELCDLILNDGYIPTHVVTVASGGTNVGSVFARLLPDSTAFMDVALSRYNASIQNLTRPSGLHAHLPYCITNQLRRLEHWLRGLVFDEKRAREKVDRITPEWANLQSIDAGARVLVLDDAVDSGVTLAIAMKAVRAHASPEVEIRSAALSTTWQEPLVKPTYSLYRGVLCRFPWSNDFHA